MTARPPRLRRTEDGTALIIAMACVLFVSLVLLAIGSGLTDDVLGAESVRTQHTVEYAADGTANVAIQTVRYSGATFANTTGNCLPTSTVTIGGVTMSATCAGVIYDPVSGATRTIDVWACPAATCTASTAIVAARVTFDDFDTTNHINCTPGGVTSTCGTSETIVSWVVQGSNN